MTFADRYDVVVLPSDACWLEAYLGYFIRKHGSSETGIISSLEPGQAYVLDCAQPAGKWELYRRLSDEQLV